MLRGQVIIDDESVYSTSLTATANGGNAVPVTSTTATGSFVVYLPTSANIGVMFGSYTNGEVATVWSMFTRIRSSPVPAVCCLSECLIDCRRA